MNPPKFEVGELVCQRYKGGHALQTDYEVIEVKQEGSLWMYQLKPLKYPNEIWERIESLLQSNCSNSYKYFMLKESP